MISGAVQGAAAGSQGGVTGAIAGAVVNSGIGALGGALDYNWLTRAQSETKNYKTDIHNLQLGNIKALPYSLSTSDALITNNNKIWPFIEIYEAK